MATTTIQTSLQGNETNHKKWQTDRQIAGAATPASTLYPASAYLEKTSQNIDHLSVGPCMVVLGLYGYLAHTNLSRKRLQQKLAEKIENQCSITTNAGPRSTLERVPDCDKKM